MGIEIARSWRVHGVTRVWVDGICEFKLGRMKSDLKWSSQRVKIAGDSK